jgi:hypothetical protein
MRKRLIVLLAASALLVMACDASSLVSQFLPQLKEAQEAIETAVPTLAAVATSAAPTSAPAKTQAAPTPTPSGPTAGGNPFADALTKARGVTKYRVEFSMVFGTTKSGKYSEEPFIDFKGEVDGKNSHMTSKGGLLAMLSGDEKGTLEFIEADGKSYVKGMALMGMYDPKVWYVDDNKSSSSFSGFAKPDEFSSFTGGANPGDFKKVRSESLDGQSCDVYLYDLKSLQNAAIVGLLGSAQDKNEFASIDKAEMSFWLCKDGYVHKFLLDYQGHDTKNATEKGALKMTGHTWDYGNPTIVVTAPKDAKPMPK